MILIDEIQKHCYKAGHSDKEFLKSVLYDLQCSGIDFSECTKRSLTKGIKESIIAVENGTAYAPLGLPMMDPYHKNENR